MTAELGQLLQAAFAAIQRRDFQTAQGFVARALAIAPDDPDVNKVAGMFAAQTGQFEEAAKRFRTVLNSNKDDFDALVGLSYTLLSTGNIADAMAASERAYRLRPGDPGVLNTLGLCRLHLGNALGALQAFDAALRIVPQVGGLHRFRGDALERLHRDMDALAAYKKAFELDPGDFQARVAAAGLMLVHDTLENALAQTKKALEINPKWTPALLLLARLQAEARKPDLAEKYFKQAVELDPGAELSMGIWLIEEGRVDEAVTQLGTFLKRQPHNAVALYWMTEARNLKDPGDPLISILESLSADNTLAPSELILVHYALGRSYDRAKVYEKAMHHIDEANRLAYNENFPVPPDLSGIGRSVDQAIKRFSAAEIENLTIDQPGSERPIFIVGMMRSGTTLLEQVVSSHPDVAAAGELRYWLERGPAAMNDPHNRARLASDYLALLRKIDPDSKRITDKTPLNYQFLGLLAASLPKAKILHIRRNPIDTCLSVYMMVYMKPPAFAHSQKSIVYAYKQYLRLMEHWRKVLPKDRFLEVDYEDLVEDQEATTRRILKFLDLEWNDACLRPERNVTAVRTPSMMQVRQGVYKTSMERWRNYEPWLRELLELRP